MINVTKTFLPPQEEYQEILALAWDAGWITNRGTLVKKLEIKLKEYLEVPNIIAMTNGTLPIQIALKHFASGGEVITTPFSYVATTSCIVWESCQPVFVDIHPEYLTIDESKIEAAITPKTTAILATHVFGNPCDVEKIEAIAKVNGLRVIYDGAHAFGVNFKGRSIFEYGDVSTCSFHATKLFHTGEGGALFCKQSHFEALYYHHNFGHDGPDKFRSVGINAKMSEIQAALGLAVLPYMDSIVTNRKNVVDNYQQSFEKIPELQTLKIRDGATQNYSYFPVVFVSESQLLKIKSTLEKENIFPRRYFYPSLNTLEYVKPQSCPISESIAKRILCLPLSHDLKLQDQNRIIGLIKKVIHE